ncbi:gluconate 2-dehydrogenase subunit 3 family protein [Lysobacter enzymogenes]|uniref:Gluconate 2-dehydrogenase subunit 3 family protein n=1 Tax=Lysobacter enzymogenes TaxID=69 RepID=A0A3N2RFM4_LYSEN|nr:gluconate 2-dehydrogenase subunit 3 family protein [Lysobacter enzymogenes]ROU06252.1 gluconate 2-dehydrogenase subunit 3 family protein [Lysobacter enzymogenes]
MERRELLKMIAAATGAAMIGVPAFVYGQAPVPSGNSAFSADEVAKLDEIADTILPRTKTPGAKDAGTGAFMATFVTDCYTPEYQAIFHAGLAEIDRRAGGRFVSLSPQARTELLRALDGEAGRRINSMAVATGGANPKAVKPHYFTMIKQLALFGFFTSKVGATQALRYIAVPGRYDGAAAYEPGTPAWAT